MSVALTSLEVAGLVRDILLISFFAIGSVALIVGLVLGLVFYRRTKNLLDRVDAGVDRIESMVESVDSTASTVMKTATSVNRGMKAGEIARSAFSSVLHRGNGEPEDKNGKPGSGSE